MEEKDWLSMATEQYQIQKIEEMNSVTEKFGLSLTQKDAEQLAWMRKETLREEQRVEFGEGILPKLIFTFCDSPYIDQESYVDTIARLQEIFYRYKNESLDEWSDEELLDFMKEAFDGVCEGSLEYLEETTLEGLARSVRMDSPCFSRADWVRGGGEEDE